MTVYTFLPGLLNMSLTAGVVIVFVLFLRLLLRKAPKVISYALWAVVLFRLLCPVSIQSGLSLFGLLDTPVVRDGGVTSSIEYIPENIVHTEYPTVTLPVPGVGEAITGILPQGREQLVADPLEAPTTIATLVWMHGVFGMVIYAAVSYIVLRRKLITASPLRDNILLADGISSPFVMGLFRPRIYLPSDLEERERSYIILHEQHHIRRFDHVVKVLAFAALCIHWFNPLVWVAFILAGRDMEMSCDEAVVKKMGEEVLADYSASLLSLATGRRIIAGMPLAFGEGDTKGRIRNLAGWKKPAFWVVLAAALASAVLAVCLLTNPTKVLIDPLEVTEVIADGVPISQERQNELVELLNDHRKTFFPAGADDPNTLSMSVEIRCADGGWYLLHYQYYSGFSFSPLHPGEDDYRSILTRFDPDGKASGAWKLEYDFDRAFSEWYREKLPIGTGSYGVVEVTYEAGMYSLVLEAGVNTPHYRIGPDMTLSEYGGDGERKQLGAMSEVILTKENFDGLFYDDTWWGKESAASIRKDNDRAWTLVCPGTDGDTLYYLLRQKNGELYLAYGYFDSAEQGDPYSDDTHIRWLFRLAGEETDPAGGIPEPLDDAIRAAVLMHNWDGRSDGLIHCEAHTVLLQKDNKREGTVTVYAMVLYQEYGFSGFRVNEAGGSHGPAALTFSVREDGGYTLEEYWIPRDGSYYTSDIREKFPRSIVEDALDTQKYILANKQSCYAQALEYGQLDAAYVTEQLLEIICSSPAQSSDPADYIEAHPGEYRELLCCGDGALRYLFGEFLKGGQTDLRGHIMRAAMEELLGGEAIKLRAGTGQEYFDAWAAAAREVYEKRGEDHMREKCPKGWLLLQMTDDAPL